jgi:hypothetical protein
LYDNPFAGLDHEDPYEHLTKSFELVGTLRALEEDEETLFENSHLILQSAGPKNGI